MHIFDKEGEQRQLLFKIRTCLPIVVSDICHNRSIYCRELYMSLSVKGVFVMLTAELLNTPHMEWFLLVLFLIIVGVIVVLKI